MTTKDLNRQPKVRLNWHSAKIDVFFAVSEAVLGMAATGAALDSDFTPANRIAFGALALGCCAKAALSAHKLQRRSPLAGYEASSSDPTP